MYEHLGKTLLCKAYYKKAKDGVYIDCYDKDNQYCDISHKEIETAFAYDRNGEKIELYFEGDGVEKKLRELTEKSFVGVCVGETLLPITEYLYADTDYHYNGEMFNVICKQIQETCGCYIVYYVMKHGRRISDG